MRIQEIIVVNPTGLHARPAASFAKLAQKYEADIKISKSDEMSRQVNAKSMLSIMLLGIGKGNRIQIISEGSDENEAVEALAKLVASGFGEI